MDLSDLRTSLLFKDVAREIPADGLGAETQNVAQGIIQKHRNSRQPESQRLCLILESVLEGLQVENIPPTATALFAALISLLQKTVKEGAIDVNMAVAICHALSLVLGHVPTAVIRSRCLDCARIFQAMLELHEVEQVKFLIPCIGQTVAASGPNDWNLLQPLYLYLLHKLLDPQPKLRKKAQLATVEVFAGLQAPNMAHVLQAAAGGLQEMSEKVLQGPEQAAHEAAKSTNKQRRQAEEKIKSAVSDALRLMGLLKQIIHLLPASNCHIISSQLLALYPLQQALLSTSTTEIFLALTNSSCEMSGQLLQNIVDSILAISSKRWNENEATVEISMVKLLENLAVRIHAMDGNNAGDEMISRIVNAVVPHLASRVEGVARESTDSIVRMIEECVSEDMILRTTEAVMSQHDRKLPSLVRIIAAIESTFGAQYFESWELSLQIAGVLVKKLGDSGASLASGILEKVGQLCAGVEDIAAQESGESAHIAKVAQDTLGICLRALGTEVVLETLPLELEEALEGRAEGRTWLIPILKMHMMGGRLGYWLSEIFPLAKRIEERKLKAQEKSQHSRDATTLYALELQLWSTMPSFCSWAADLPDVFIEWTRTVESYFQKRNDLRLCICQSVQIMLSQERRILAHLGIDAGFADPCNTNKIEDTQKEDEKLDATTYLERYSREYALQTREVMQTQSRVWLPLLLNAFVTTHSNRRSHIQGAISSYSGLCDEEIINAVFKSTMTRLIKVAKQAETGELGKGAVLDGGDTDTERYCTYLEAAYALLAGLQTEGLSIIYQLTMQGILEKDPAIQKKCYKILLYLIEDRCDFMNENFENIVIILLQGSKTSISASRGFRIKCLKAVILNLMEGKAAQIDVKKLEEFTEFALEYGSGSDNDLADKARIIMMPMVSEIVLSIKESNKKTRAAAFDLIVDVAKEMDRLDPELGVVSFVRLVLGGLVGSTAQMVSATVMALARLLFEFTPIMLTMIHDLFPAILMLLRSKAREVVKSVLGFLKVAVMRLDTDILSEYTPRILESTLIWAEDSKNKFRLKVRVILERLAKKVGFELLDANMPEAHKSLLTHIRKQLQRKDRIRTGQSEMDWDGETLDGSMKSRARSGRSDMKSRWQSDMFSDDSDLATIKQSKSIASAGKILSKRGGQRSVTKASLRSAPTTTARGTVLAESNDPMNLLEASTSRRMVGMNVRRSGYVDESKKEEEEVQFQQGKDGRLIIKEQEEVKKRRRDEFLDGFDSDDSDMEDIKGIHGASLALRGATSIAKASSYAGTIGQKSRATSTGGKKGAHHSGDRFKAKSGTGGDIKGKNAVQPYAYWPLDRKMLNRRHHKTRKAKADLDKVVNAAKEGAIKGRKAKRRKT